MKKRYWLIALILMLTVVVITLVGRKEWLLDNEGDCFSTLAFVDREETAEEKIIPYYSRQDGIYYLFLPSCANLQDVTIYFEGAKGAVFQKGEESLELKRGETIRELETDTLYEFFFEGGESDTAAAGFQILHSANLPALFLETESGSMEAVDDDKDYQESGRYTLVDVDGTLLYADELDHITGRGNSTWYYEKKSYGIKLKSEADMLGMGSADAWILLSNVEDNTYLRNKITYDMAVAAGMDGAPQSRYIDLYINHSYHGMYLLCEKVEMDQNRLPFTDLGEENKKLNKDIRQSEPVTLEDGKCVRLGMNPKDISGGYILERDVYSKYRKEVSGFQTSLLGDLYTIKSPEYASVEETQYIKDLVNGMERAVTAEDGVDRETGKSIWDYIDIKSFAQKYVIEELCKNNGAGATSSYFYKPQDSVSTRIFAGPVWDYDKGYGKREGFDSSARDLCYMTQRAEGTTLFWYLNRHPEFTAAVKECYEEFFSDYIDEVLAEKIPEYISQISASVKMEAVRWKEAYGEIGEEEQRAGTVIDFLTQRREFLNQVWLEDAELATVHFVAAKTKRDTYMSVIRGECLEAAPPVDQDYQDEDEGDKWYTADGEEFDITEPIIEDMTVYADRPEASAY